MQTTSKTDWWRRRRVLWPLGVALVGGLTVAVAVARAWVSRVVVYNETGADIAELTVSACGQSRTFRDVADQESVRLKLAATGGESDIAVTTNGVPMWRGDYLEPCGGYRAIVRLRADGEVECSTMISWWRGWFSQPVTAAN